MDQMIIVPIEIQHIAETELNEVPNRVTDDIDHIRKWLLKQSHVKARTDDYTLLMFLRSCKFSLERTKRKLELFYAVKGAFPDLFLNRDPFDRIAHYILEQKIVSAWSYNSSFILLVRFSKLDPDILSINEAIKVFIMLLDVITRTYVESTVLGFTAIVDLKDMPVKYLAEITPQFLKKVVLCFQKAYPLRIKAIHFTSVPIILTSVINIFKSFLSRKLRQRVFVNPSDYYTILEHCFPEGYGGTLESVEESANKLKAQVESYHDWFLKDHEYRSFEGKTSLSSKINIDLFSFDGSFRKLEID